MNNEQFVLEVPIRWMDLDAYNHVNNAKYLDYMVETRWQWFASKKNINKWSNENSVQFILIKQSIEYLKSFKYPSTVVVKQKIQNIGRTSIHFEYEFMEKNSGDIIFTKAEGILVCYAELKKKPIKIPDFIKNEMLS